MRHTDALSRPSTAQFAIVCGLIGAAAYWFVIAGLVAQWLDDPNYTHGLFIPAMAGVLIWRRRERLAAAPVRPSLWGVVVLLAAAALYVVGVAGAELFTMRMSMVGMIAGLVLLTQGWRRTRILLLPLVLLLMMVPLPYILYYKLTFPLQLQSSALTAKVLAVAGMPVAREGNVLRLEHYTLEVVTACSGLRSIMTLGAMALFVMDFLRVRWWARILFLAAVVPIAVAANTVRLLATAAISALSGVEAAEGFLHGVSGVAVFMVGLLMLIITGRVLEWVSARRT